MKLEFQNVRLPLGRMSLELNLALECPATAFFGPSGSGKTSLLELVAGLRKPERGVIALDGVPLVDISQKIFIPARERAIGYIPQDLALFPHLTVRQNIEYSRRAGHGAAKNGISVEKLYRVLDIEKLLDRTPGSLSGGEKQRTAFARALLSSPRVLLFDEPLASLDQDLKDRILPYLERLHEEFGVPMIYVTHSTAEVVALCEEVVVLQEGKCVGRGKVSEMFQPIETRVFQLRDGSLR
jgi:molybdate transport system ATP-binding protein